MILGFFLFLTTALAAPPGVFDFGKSSSATCPIPEAKLGYSAIETLVNGSSPGKMRSPEDLLGCLPESYRRNYTLAYSSRSEQKGTESKPRVILYGKDAKLMMTFTQDNQGAERVEILEWSDATSTFVPREIVFPAKGAPKTAKAQVNPKPTNCVQCHESPIHPNWDPYNTWAGFYGSLSRNHVDSMGTTECANYKKYQVERQAQIKKGSGIYRFLPQMKPLPPDELRDSAGIPAGCGIANGSTYEPNGRLTDLVSTLNFMRVQRQVMASPSIGKAKFALAAAALTCNDLDPVVEPFDAFLPPSVQDKGSKSYASTREEVATLSAQEYAARQERMKSAGDTRGVPNAAGEGRASFDFDSYRSDLMGGFRYLSDRFGWGFSSWSMAYNQEYGFSNGGKGIEALAARFIYELSKDPELANLLQGLVSAPRSFSSGAKSAAVVDGDVLPEFIGGTLMDENRRKICAVLKERSLAALRDPVTEAPAPNPCPSTAPAVPAPPLPQQASLKKLLAMPQIFKEQCLSCHTGKSPIGPYIPFDSEEKLQAALKGPRNRLNRAILERMTAKNPDDRMPQGAKDLDPDTRRELESYLSDLRSAK